MASLGHTRASSVIETGKHPYTNARYNIPAGQEASNGGTPGPREKLPLPHIDDIIGVQLRIPPDSSIKKLLYTADTFLQQAEMGIECKRPDRALEDFITASIIAINLIRAHKDYPSMKGDRTDLGRAHAALLRKIGQQDDTFARIKQEIIADNKRSGVQPTRRRSALSQGDGIQQGSSRPSSSSGRETTAGLNGSSEFHTAVSPEKVKPVVHPKPQSLHGNSIRPSHPDDAATNHRRQELIARFANLRGPQASPGQDPRIKTHPLALPKPAGPREMPPPKPRLSLGSSVPSLPKMPEAIYSPARVSISGESGRPPKGTPRGILTRSGSSASISSTPGPSAYAQVNDYFTPTQSYSNNSMPPAPLSSSVKIPIGETITSEELMQAMKANGSILIIDVRLREDFDEGHIMSSSTICIEPSILLRDDLSAEDISDSLVLSPSPEQLLFERRDKYDLVVIYDQDSQQIPKSARSSDDLVIISLHRALVSFNYGKELKNPPKILKGGLNAWVDLLGAGSLQSSIAVGVSPSQLNRNPHTIERKRSKYVVKPLKPDEVKVWQETLKKDDMQTASSPGFTRTTEDFLRRFPPVSTVQQSMTSPKTDPKTDPRTAYGRSHKGDLFTDLPSPPKRPAPALPRPSYSGLSQNTADDEIYDDTGLIPSQRQGPRTATKASEQPSGDGFKHFTGLNNPGNWCYANSTLQSLLASPDFGRELADSEWMTKYVAPRKADERIDHPQLMVRIMGNLFHWMSSGKFNVMKAQTLMDYSRSVSKHSRIEDFGGAQQQDAQEFMSFLLTHLHDETNCRRDRIGKVLQPDTKRQSLLQAASEYWRYYLNLNQSIVDRYWRGIELSTVECVECHTRTHTFATFDWLPVTVNMGRDMTLQQTLDEHTADNTLDDFSCNHCGHATRALQSLSFARLPSILCVAFRRFHFHPGTGTLQKSTAAITWDFDDCDFSRWFLHPDDCANNGEVSDRAFTGPFRYECYAVIVHAGRDTASGHYMAYVRDSASHDPHAWLCCNDSAVTKVRIGSGDKDDIQERIFRHKDCVPYLVFFRRKRMS